MSPLTHIILLALAALSSLAQPNPTRIARRQFPTLNSEDPPPVISTAFTAPALRTSAIASDSTTPLADPATLSVSSGVAPQASGSSVSVLAPLEAGVTPSESSSVSISVSLPAPAASPTASAAGQQIASTEGAINLKVIETKTEDASPAGLITSHCLTLASDASQVFCRTLLDGAPLGGDGGFGGAAVPTSAAGASSASIAPSLATASVGSTFTAPTVSPLSSGAPALPVASSDVVAAPSSNVVASSSVGQSAASSEQPSAVVAAPSSTESPSAEVPSPTIAPFEPATANASASVSASPDPSAETTPTPIPSDGASDTTVQPSASPSIISPSASLAPTTAQPPLTSTIAAPASSATGTPPLVDAAFAQNDINPDEIPGQTMPVLPIGLGVTGGLIGLALLIAAYMLWQRRRYRQQFIIRSEAAENKVKFADA